MAQTNLINMEVELIVSDPWEFCTELGAGPFNARILQVGKSQDVPDKDAVLIQLLSPVTYREVTCEFFVASPRHENETLQSLGEGREVSCGLTVIPVDRAHSPNPFDLSWWRGGVGLIGTLRAGTEASAPEQDI